MSTPEIIEGALSLVLALVFGVSAIPKLRHPRGFLLVVLIYRVLPPRPGRLYARLLPPLELLIALLLLSGTAVRLAATVAAALLLSFIVAVAVNMRRGRDLDCHCFGHATGRRIGWTLLLQDGALLVACIAVATFATTWATAEHWSIFRVAGLATPESPAPLFGCTGLSAGTALLLGSPLFGGRRFGQALISGQ
jgi:hypothetical protein